MLGLLLVYKKVSEPRLLQDWPCVDVNVERPHPFVQALLGGVFVSSLHDSFRRIPGATKLGYWLTPNKVKQKRVVFNKYCRDLVAKYV